jgi:NADH:ubiquinone oxidoreductase subunit K
MVGLELTMLSIIYGFLIWFDFSYTVLESVTDFTAVFAILTVVVCESAVGLTLIMLLSRHTSNLGMNQLNKLRG